MFCVFFLVFENNCPGVGALARFFCPRDRGFFLFIVPRGGGTSPFKKVPGALLWGLALGPMVRLGID